MTTAAKEFLDAWMDYLTIIGQSGAGLSHLLIADAARAGISEAEIRVAAGGDIDAYLLENGVKVELH